MQHDPRQPARRSLLACGLLWWWMRPDARAATAELPLHLESSETGDELKGSVRAISPYAFSDVSAALAAPQVWCEILMLHLNNKACRLLESTSGPALLLAIARKHEQSADKAQLLQLDWRRQEQSAAGLRVRLHAAQGPFGTTDYTVLLQLEPAPGGHTAIRFSYACRFSPAARMLLGTYLATVGSNKVGFTALAGGRPDQRVGGLRGVVERTVMRYFLAIDAWLQAASLPPAERAQARLEAWFDATERYPRQLREVDKATYLRNKRRELGLTP